jgi:hypothetical protein
MGIPNAVEFVGESIERGVLGRGSLGSPACPSLAFRIRECESLASFATTAVCEPAGAGEFAGTGRRTRIECSSDSSTKPRPRSASTARRRAFVFACIIALATESTYCSSLMPRCWIGVGTTPSSSSPRPVGSDARSLATMTCTPWTIASDGRCTVEN